MASVFFLVMFSVSPLLIHDSSAEEKKYYSGCPPLPCVHLGPIRFPFNHKKNPECDCSLFRTYSEDPTERRTLVSNQKHLSGRFYLLRQIFFP